MPFSRNELNRRPGGRGGEGRAANGGASGVGDRRPADGRTQNARRMVGAGSSFAARFGRVILQHGIAALPSALYHFGGKLDLYAQHVWFISYILSHKWDEDLPYPSLGVMSHCSGMSKRQLQRYSDELREMGYLIVYPRVSPQRGQEANAYDFAPLFEQLEACIVEQRKELQGDSVSMTNPMIGLPISEQPVTGPLPVPGREVARQTWASMDELLRSERDPSFVARYGRVIAHYGVAAVPRALFTCSHALGLTPQQIWFVAYIFSYQWDTALPYPSIVRMGALTGYTPAYLHRLKASLVERGYLRLVHRTKVDGGQDSNAYDFSPLLDEISNLLQPTRHETNSQSRAESRANGDGDGAGGAGGAGTAGTANAKSNGQPGAGGKSRSDECESGEVPLAGDSQSSGLAIRRKARRGSLAAMSRKDRQVDMRSSGERGSGDQRSSRHKETRIGHSLHGDDTWYTEPSDGEYAGPHAIPYIYGGDVQYSGEGDVEYRASHDMQYAPAGDVTLPGPVTAASYRPVTRRLEPPATGDRDELEAYYLQKDEKNDSSHISHSEQESNREVKPQRIYSSYIARIATDFSYELGDPQHVMENASQAQHLWHRSMLDEAEFVELMYEAKKSTRQAQGKHGTAGVQNKMAYFFVCLRRLALNSEGGRL